MEEEKQKDKALYCYKQALSQPYWIQKLNDEISLSQPIRLSWVIYFVVIFGFLFSISLPLFPFVPIGLRGVFSVFIAFNVASILSEMVIDGKAFLVYLIDYLLFYFNYGKNADGCYINKGNLYQKNKKEKGK